MWLDHLLLRETEPLKTDEVGHRRSSQVVEVVLSKAFKLLMVRIHGLLAQVVRAHP